MTQPLTAFAAALTLTGCGSYLPSAHQDQTHAWHSFDEVKARYEQIEPLVTRFQTAQALGFDPTRTPNTLVLNHSQLMSSLAPRTPPNPSEMPEGLLRCQQNPLQCTGYQFEYTQLHTERVGSFWLDFLNFRRDTLTTGWKFSSLLVVVNGTVVHKQWSGQPQIRLQETRRNPLGPLQGFGENAIK